MEQPINNLASIRNYPSTRFRGSKRKLIPWLAEHFAHLSFSSALDVFGGTGVVSYLLKRMGKAVTYNDVLHFNYTIGKAIIENDDVVLLPRDLTSLYAVAKSISPPRRPGIVETNFDGYYFTSDENRWIDRVITSIQKLFPRTDEQPSKRDITMYALFQTCLTKRPFNLFHRRNLYLRTADVKRTFGNKTTWERPIAETYIDFLTEANSLVFSSSAKCAATNYNAADIPYNAPDLVYLDPPYLKKSRNETADYRFVYHFLEGMSRYNEWPSLIDLSTHTRRLTKLQNPWTTPASNLKEFDLLFERYKSSIIVISYKRHGKPSIETLIRHLKQFKRKVRSFSQHYTYALNHQNGDAALNRECLIIGE